MKVLITGGSGFIGTRLATDLLAGGHDVILFDKVRSAAYPDRTVVGDVRDAASLQRCMARMDVIYHLAAEHCDDVRPERLYFDVNVGGAEAVTKAADANNVQTIIFTSTVAVYPLDGGMPDESHSVAPFNAYGMSKLQAEQVFNRWAERGAERRCITVRPSVVFGENNRGNVYNLLSEIHRRRFLFVGNGHNRKSMAYVGNLTHFLIQCLTLPSGIHLFNYADKPDLSTNQLVAIAMHEFDRGSKAIPRIPYAIGLVIGYGFDALATLTGRRFKVSSVRVRKFCADTTVCAERSVECGFEAPYTLEEALRRTIRSEFAPHCASILD
jgi:nucleoside-diphosphate-sugar epimerase